MVKKKFDTWQYVAVALISILIFISGFILGRKITHLQTSYLNSEIESVYSDVQENIIDFFILEISGKTDEEKRVACDFFNQRIYKISDRVGELAKNIETFEKNNGFEDKEYKKLKSKYMDFLLRQWLFSKKIKDSCGGNFSIIIFFYRNVPPCQECIDQGIVLDYFKKELGEKLFIFSFDTGIDSPSVLYMMNLYNITRVPSVVFEEKVYNRFVSKDEVQKELCSKNIDGLLCDGF
ncbi:MAG: hypothetical protein NZ893_00050 [Candidatus Aenigmarchaeota archaeon]|nr:hypothetical protein [Candidatus Aenigmarchaeota archaeon]